MVAFFQVLDRGLIVEFDSPSVLLSNPSSVFAGLVADSAMEHK